MYVDEGSTSTIRIWSLNIGNNPTSTELALQDSISQKYIQLDGTLGQGAVWQVRDSWALDIQAEVATDYAIRVKARNLDGIETAFSLTSKVSTYSYPSGMSTLSSITSSSVDLEIDPNGNPSYVNYAINETQTDLYVQPDGTLAEVPTWQTNSEWGITTISGFEPDQYVGFNVKSRYNSNQETSSDLIAYAHTMSNIPSAPTVEVLSSSSISIDVDPNDNPNSVYYAIQEVTTEQYINYYNGLWFEEDWRTDEFWDVFTLSGLNPSSEYSFRVKARNSDGIETDFGPTINIFTLAGPPLAPVLISPANNSTDLPISITLSWNTVEQADSYGIELAHGWFYENNIVLRDSGITETSIQVDNLLHGEGYYWRVSAKNAYGTSAWSEAWQFATIAGPPPAPTLYYPENGAVDVTYTEPYLGWYLANGAEGFSVQVSLNPEFSSTVVDTSYNISSWNDPHYLYLPNYSLPLSLNTTYYWRVNSTNTYGASPWSDTWWFTTIEGTDIPYTNNSNVNIYPNPAEKVLHITGLSGANISVRVISELGITVLQGKLQNNCLNIQSLQPGIYLLRVESSEGITVKRFIKE
jgi:hypothetical protein